MLQIADRSIEDVIRILAAEGIEAGYLVPTPTGLEKSILDAHAGLRDYFKLTGFHDYQQQAQGSEAKIIAEGYFVTPNGLEKTKVSLYRPETKNGDPRIWIYGLKDRARAGNLLAIFSFEGVLYIVNVSNEYMLSLNGIMNHNFITLVRNIVGASNKVAMELLEKLQEIANRGWVPSLRAGSTGVGYTLEEMLGIAANNSKDPDYKGIEIKSGRLSKGRASSRTTIFAKTPDWNQSVVKNGLQLLNGYGYRSVSGRLQLYCSLNNNPNTLGHFLDVPDDNLMLHAMHRASLDQVADKVLVWEMEKLRSSLAKKHRETFWVKAMTRLNAYGGEDFQYFEVTHTKSPLLANMVDMFRLGYLELDYLLHEKFGANGEQQARDHGYLFKIWPKHLDILFPPSKSYILI